MSFNEKLILKGHPKSEPRAPKDRISMIWKVFGGARFLVFWGAAKGRPKLRKHLHFWRQVPKTRLFFVGLAECVVLPKK